MERHVSNFLGWQAITGRVPKNNNSSDEQYPEEMPLGIVASDSLYLGLLIPPAWSPQLDTTHNLSCILKKRKHSPNLENLYPKTPSSSFAQQCAM